MIEQVTLKNVKQHLDIAVDFTRGVNILRGANEAGKTTILEGISYCLFGAKAVSGRLEDMVTYGKKKSQLKSSVKLGFGTVTRSASGAEIVDKSGNVVCSGQMQVTEYVENILNIPSGSSHLLMIAKQKEITGIVDGGNAQSFIESLANFEKVDTFIGAVQDKFLTGSTAPARAQLESAQSYLGTLVKPVAPIKPEISKLDDDLKRLNTKLESRRSIYARLSEEISKTLAQEEAYNKNIAEKSRLEGVISALSMGVFKVEPIDDGAEAEANKELSTYSQLVNDYRYFTDLEQSELRLPEYPEVVWEGSEESLQQEINNTTATIQLLRDNIENWKTEAAVLESKIVKDPICFNCGAEIKDWEISNAKIEKGIKDLTNSIDKSEEELESLVKDNFALSGITMADTTYESWIAEVSSKFVEVDYSAIPRKINLVNKPDRPDPDIAESAKKTLDEISAIKARNAETLSREQTRLTNLSKAESELAALDNKIVKPLRSVTELRKEAQDIYDSIQANEKEATSISTSINRIIGTYDAEVVRYTSDSGTYEAAVHRVNEAKSDLRKLEEANSLLKAVRLARTEVVTNIWNSVLGSISNYFSVMRGKPSIIARHDKGFTCNDMPVSELSGSSIDLLGLAFRAGLTKMFLPGLNLQILDEPTAACDMSRSNNMMGFIGGLGFGQTIIVTHADYDEALADNLIELGSSHPNS